MCHAETQDSIVLVGLMPALEDAPASNFQQNGLRLRLDKEKTYRDIIQKLSESRRSAGFSDRAWKVPKLPTSQTEVDAPRAQRQHSHNGMTSHRVL